jgi:hypothetical protein
VLDSQEYGKKAVRASNPARRIQKARRGDLTRSEGSGREAQGRAQRATRKKAIAFLRYWGFDLTDHEAELLVDSLSALLVGQDLPDKALASGFQKWLHFREEEAV